MTKDIDATIERLSEKADAQARAATQALLNGDMSGARTHAAEYRKLTEQMNDVALGRESVTTTSQVA
ncbi:hypothetical protein [Agromyces sp. SYSU T00194]|uniref:hypothetical protein n=1 Tax=Agromyces chitinivorans TaxID=3158560 RepID=UPI0033996FE8